MDGQKSHGLDSAQSSCKRRRTNSPGSEIHDPSTQNTLVRDEKYYKDDADCVIRVEDTLFKAHRFLLSQDSSAFQNMFSLPEGSNATPQGSCDDDPIVLFGDTPDQFRALCWALYALPTDIQKQGTADADIQKLISLATITHKYHFQSFESWAMDSIFAFCSRDAPPHPSNYLFICPADDLSRIIEVSLLCNRADLRDLVTNSWTNRLLKVRDPCLLGPTLRASDKYGLRRLQGLAYYQQLLEMDLAQPVGNTTVTVFSPPGLSQKQIQRLLSGYWSLSRYWERLSQNPPMFARPPQCPSVSIHSQVCLQLWILRWREIIRLPEVNKSGVFVVQKFQYLRDLLSKDALLMKMSASCRMAALGAFENTGKKFSEELAKHFLCSGVD